MTDQRNRMVGIKNPSTAVTLNTENSDYYDKTTGDSDSFSRPDR
ncbi:MAG: hypothetical protein ACJZ8O_09220 [Pirellulaceae bacterium]